MSYANRCRPPRTLTTAEAKRLLDVSGKSANDFMDHVLFALALGTGLRVAEMSALDCGDVFNKEGNARTRIELRTFKGSGRDKAKPQEVMVGDGLRNKLESLLLWKEVRTHRITRDAPLFMVATGRPTRHRYGGRDWRRMSKRRIGERFVKWRDVAQLPPSLTCHALRHTFLQRLYDETKDLLVVKRAARHASITTTTIYAQASADDVLRAVKEIE